ncbi:Uncharacterized protein TCM_018588 [Theobroma cacao]|uniref:Uncharacterized protein n=1 Tax=Theobroma cacao TaxID=3641 RepID=A0A061EER9_THECC|nr:Uncharacterized protein TCM_018588 [Theobroma cacao]
MGGGLNERQRLKGIRNERRRLRGGEEESTTVRDGSVIDMGPMRRRIERATFRHGDKISSLLSALNKLASGSHTKVMSLLVSYMWSGHQPTSKEAAISA